VHGEYRHLVSARELAQELGFSAERILVTENGTAIKLTSAKISLGEQFPGGKVFIDSEAKEIIDEEVIRDRKNMGLHGLIFVSLMVDPKKYRLVGGPEIFCRGFLSEEETHLIAKAENSVRGEVIALLRDLNGDISDIEDVVCRQVRRFFKRETGQRPIIIPSVMAL
jgi:ribonuclease J